MSKDPMSKIRAGDVWKGLHRVLQEYRIDDYDVRDKRPHPVLTVRFCGQEREMQFPGTPSSHRAPREATAKLRRLLKEMQMLAVGGTAVVQQTLVPAQLQQQSLTMSSREIADLCDARHNDVCATIARLFERGVLRESRNTLRTYAPSGGGRPTQVFDLTKRDTLVVVSGYQDEVRARIIDRWIELESRQSVELAVLPADWDRLVGMVKMLAHKVTETEKQVTVITSRFDNGEAVPAFDLAGTVTSLRIIELAGIASDQRVRGTSAIVTRAMKNYCLCKGYRAQPTPEHIDSDRRWRFPREAAMEWLLGDSQGGEIIRSHVARQRAKSAKAKGQMALVLVDQLGAAKA